jgi:hypothetical protein
MPVYFLKTLKCFFKTSFYLLKRSFCFLISVFSASKTSFYLFKRSFCFLILVFSASKTSFCFLILVFSASKRSFDLLKPQFAFSFKCFPQGVGWGEERRPNIIKALLGFAKPQPNLLRASELSAIET